MKKDRLAKTDLSKKIESKQKYNKKLEKYQMRLLALQQILRKEKIAVIIAMEGWDAAGKGGAIKRITEHLDPRGTQVIPIGAPAPHEQRYHYLQRFWRKIPQYGQITIFDRSWYGRVLVERVEGFATKEEWKRAYDEINEFEKLLTDDHYIVAKFFFHISQDVQLTRFKEREQNPLKQWKITEEDWRNRDKWEEYVEASEDMFEQTDKPNAMWNVIPSNDKMYARLKTLKTLIVLIEDYFSEHNIELPTYYQDMNDSKQEETEQVQEVSAEM
ncbi:polyphosphate kinase 2 family protein [Ectobacillus sp. sgz5001026]|uniref:polyphosphate kinase 2 family protein n=1 Tax=Ectobacillus sp. sgz5001026 TaxID=3242473 RepID=UPI0036D439C5